MKEAGLKADPGSSLTRSDTVDHRRFIQSLREPLTEISDKSLRVSDLRVGYAAMDSV